ncbi:MULTISPECIES: FadR/GntR family transcriptional regulator [Providencia]|uniref:L-lactate utilization operon repressor n=1 Tax=Providencia rettgeri TaxID=587 RepID=A0A379FXL9_PRORE|nr:MULTISPECIES: GntR family transcriptional regulator [Providencia]EJD6377489.1 FadR family transcriptional regulator [Providencia rettgeri]EJF7712700.1 FadR family transcriptional regulator [Providencia rettgeri]ELR5118513.1 FadR family transcriptional regulator [Providencia rettgeri]MBI6202448.1 FadR family transcriptional regulator [Providencia rettgeri]MCG5281096.1 FCD domain-containing protein [Providencia rettgeri]
MSTNKPTTIEPVRIKRTDEIVNAIKETIMADNLIPGDRLPQEKELIEHYNASKSTVREALKSLEVQGLIKTKTGPGGGAFIDSMTESRAMSLLSNYLFTRDISIKDIYTLRKLLEPVVAVSAIDNIDNDGIQKLYDTIAIYDHEPADENERWQQRMAELDFHAVVASYSDNVLLVFICHFLQRLLKDLAVCKDIYLKPEPVDRRQGIEYQYQLIEALRRKDAEKVQSVMEAHMAYAEQAMLALQATLQERFLSEDR